jgi:DNA-binding MarR family transcriptional regulator
MQKTLEHVELSGHIIERTVKKMKLSFARMLNKLDADVTVDQWVILNILRKEDGLSQLEIARHCYKDAPTVTRILDLLSSKGLIERKADPSDRRRFKICLTQGGIQKIDDLLPTVTEFRVKSYAGIHPNDLQQLHSIMNTIFENLDSINNN